MVFVPARRLAKFGQKPVKISYHTQYGAKFSQIFVTNFANLRNSDVFQIHSAGWSFV